MPVSAQLCVVIGGGFLGSALAESMQRQGQRVIVLDSRDGQDAADPAVLRAVLAQGMPKTIFCCQATHGGTAADYRHAYWDVVQTIREVCPAARIVFCSSLGASADGGRAALLRQTEAAVTAAGGVVLRLAALYGEGRCELLRRHLAGEPKLGGAETRVLRYLHREDAVAALLIVASQPAGRYAAVGECLVKAEIYRSLEQWTGVPASAESAPLSSRAVLSPEILPAPARWQPCRRMEDFVKNEMKHLTHA